MTGQKKIGIFGNNNVEVYQGIEGTQMYDAKYNGEFLLDCQ
jgi:hypothetical protein